MIVRDALRPELAEEVLGSLAASTAWQEEKYFGLERPYFLVTPEFNSLVLFRVSRESMHFVTPVAPHAQGGRLSVSGWWHRAVALPAELPVATVLGGIHPSPGMYGEPTSVVGGRGGVVAL